MGHLANGNTQLQSSSALEDQVHWGLVVAGAAWSVRSTPWWLIWGLSASGPRERGCGVHLARVAHSSGDLSSLCTRVLEKRNTFLSDSDAFLREPITKLAFPPGALLAGLTQ